MGTSWSLARRLRQPCPLPTVAFHRASEGQGRGEGASGVAGLECRLLWGRAKLLVVEVIIINA